MNSTTEDSVGGMTPYRRPTLRVPVILYLGRALVERLVTRAIQRETQVDQLVTEIVEHSG